ETLLSQWQRYGRDESRPARRVRYARSDDFLRGDVQTWEVQAGGEPDRSCADDVGGAADRIPAEQGGKSALRGDPITSCHPEGAKRMEDPPSQTGEILRGVYPAQAGLRMTVS